MIYGSVCSGIEAATVAWHPLGWRPSFFSEIEAFPRAVLAHHYPNVPLHGDFTTIESGQYEPIDLLVGGTPCQDFSIAGLRAGIVGDRGNLTLQFLKLAQRLRPQWIVWGNVPGVLSSTSHVAPDPRPPEIDLDGDNGPRDGEEVVVTDEYDADESHALACFMAGLSELGYGFAARVLDAQYFGVPQRRRREFVVGYLGDWRPAAAVLFERESLSGHPAPGRQAGQGIAGTATAQSGRGRGAGIDPGLLAPPLTSNPHGDHESREGLLVAGTLQATSGGRTPGLDASGAAGGHLVAFGGNNTTGPIDVATALSSHGGPHGRQDFESETFIAHALRGEGFDASEDGTGRGTPLVPLAMNLRGREGGAMPELDDVASLRAASGGSSRSYVAFDCKAGANTGFSIGEVPGSLRGAGHGGGHAAVAYSIMPQNSGKDYKARQVDVAQPLMAGGPVGGNQGGDYIRQHTSVRRLTPRECERLQGFPDDYTAITHRGKPAADGPRYKALGNSMAVPCMRWIGERIELVSALMADMRSTSGSL